MTVIGILAPENCRKIESALRKMLRDFHKRIATVQGVSTHTDELFALKQIGTDYCVIQFDKNRIQPHYVDILILDNTKNERLISYDLIKCISPTTRLIYNIDNHFLPIIDHPNAIDYGLSRNATVSISSIDPLADGASFVCCVQRPFKTLFDACVEEGELRVDLTFEKSNITNILPAVTCGLLCGLLTKDKVKI